MMNAAEASFKAYLESFALLPENVYADGVLRHCGKHGKHEKNGKFAWYRLSYLAKEGRYIGKFGAFNGLNETWDLLDASNRILASKEKAKKQASPCQEYHSQEHVDRIIQNVLALRTRSSVNSPYMTDKQLAIHERQDAFVLTGKDLLQAGVKQVRQWKDFESLPFLVVCMKVNNDVKSLQLICHAKTSYVWDKRVKKYIPITEEANRKGKLFLSGGASRGAYLPLLSEGANLSDCETIVFAEGYAKSVALRMAISPKAAVLTVFSVGNYASVIDNLLKQSPNPALTNPQETGIQGKKLIIASDNDEVGRKVTKRLLQKYPFLTACYPENPCKDADDLFRHSGINAVRDMLKRASRDMYDVNTRRVQVAAKQYLSDAAFKLEDNIQWLIADTGLGKTSYVIRYAVLNPEKMVVLACPTNGICQQVAYELMRHNIPFQLVMEGQQFNYDSQGLIVTTYASLARKFSPDKCLYPLVLFIDEAHCLSSDIYRQQDISAIYKIIPCAEKTILMTATPHLHHHFGLQWHQRILVTQTDRPLTIIRQLFYPASELAVIKHYAAKGRLVVEINSKSGMKKMSKWLAREGVSGVYCMNAELKDDPSGVYQYIIENEKLPADCKILLTTKLYETGLNIKDTDIQTVLIFAKKPLETGFKPDAVPLPHDIKQIANRTRCCSPDVFLCLPSACDKDTQAAFNGSYEYKRLRRRAKQQQMEYCQEIASGSFDMAKASYESALRETTPRLLYFADGDCHISESGLDMAVCEMYGKRITYCGAFRRDELSQHGLLLEGDVMFDELTQEIALTAQQAETFLQVSEEVKETLDTEFQADVERLTVKTDKDLRYDESPVAQRLLWLRKHFQQGDASAVLKEIGRESRAFGEVKGRINVLKGRLQKEHIPSAFAIDDFLKCNQFTGRDAAAMMTRVFQADRILQHELDDNWRDNCKREMSEKRAMSYVRKFADIRARHTEQGNIYIPTDRFPIMTLYHKATGKNLSEDEFFKKSIFANFKPSSPATRSKMPDTLRKQKLYSSKEFNVSAASSNLDVLIDDFYGLPDYAKAQLLTFGKVF